MPMYYAGSPNSDIYCPAYPPFDEGVYYYFREPQARTSDDDVKVECKYLAFFAALFENAVPELQNALDKIPAREGSIPARWRRYLALEGTEYDVGPNRKTFYGKVTEDANRQVRIELTSHFTYIKQPQLRLGIRTKGVYIRPIDLDCTYSTFDIEEWTKLATEGGMKFADVLRRYLESSTHAIDNQLAKARVLYFLYFDEAHVLNQVEPAIRGRVRSKYHLLGRVLDLMRQLPFFTVFLSTNSWLGSFAPSVAKHPSLRDFDNVILHAPFTELSFDAFALDSFGILLQQKQVVRLRDVCTLDYIVKFGRPL
jgi:hypothetical protein